MGNRYDMAARTEVIHGYMLLLIAERHGQSCCWTFSFATIPEDIATKVERRWKGSFALSLSCFITAGSIVLDV